MTTYGELVERSIVNIVTNDVDTLPEWKVGVDNVKSIELLDIKERAYLVNFENGETDLFYNVIAVRFSK